MIPPVRALYNAFVFAQRRHPTKPALEHEDLIESLTDAHTEAMRLAHACGDDVGALFYAHARYAVTLGEVFTETVILVTLQQAKEHGRSLEIPNPIRALRAMAREIAGGALAFDDFRAWFDDRFPPG